MNNLLEQLHDIEGLDHISWWPLAIGWWIVIGLGIVLMGVIIWFGVRRLAFMRSWKNDTLKKLAHLEKQLSDDTARASAITLSEYLRRIALKRFSRKECAGLVGNSWLKWLTKHDPKGFDWENKGVLLTDVPYSPVDHRLSANQIKELIQAVRDWVR
jgi:hypothetical protein